MILVKFDNNYADEFDMQGFMLMTQTEFDLMLAYARERFIEAAGEYWHKPIGYYSYESFHDSTVEKYFGTNEAFSFDSYEDYMLSISCQQVTDAEVTTIKKLFPDAANWCGYGECVNFEDY